MSHAKNELDRVDARYDPENDLIDGAPRVTHTDKVLIDVVKEIIEDDDLATIKAEVFAISKDLHSIKRELGRGKLRRIEAELEGYDFEKVEKLYPEVHVRAALAAILEILAE